MGTKDTNFRTKTGIFRDQKGVKIVQKSFTLVARVPRKHSLSIAAAAAAAGPPLGENFAALLVLLYFWWFILYEK